MGWILSTRRVFELTLFFNIFNDFRKYLKLHLISHTLMQTIYTYYQIAPQNPSLLIHVHTISEVICLLWVYLSTVNAFKHAHLSMLYTISNDLLRLWSWRPSKYFWVGANYCLVLSRNNPLIC